ncbi:MAG: hypothetical protein N4A47_01420 [Clostridia bacterium]|jgi:deoxyhypusine synthase|nr:hypothetical protein [Clostridia bacterium]
MINYPNDKVENFCNTYKEFICGHKTLDIENMSDEKVEELYNYFVTNEDMLCNFFFSFWKNFFDMKNKVTLKHEEIMEKNEN